MQALHLALTALRSETRDWVVMSVGVLLAREGTPPVIRQGAIGLFGVSG